jgi:hypothetical protein
MRSIARWLMHAREQGGYPIRWFSHQRVAGIGLLQKRRSGSIAPKVLEPRRRQFRIAHGVLDIAVAQISVKRPRICLLLAEAKQQASETYRGPPCGRSPAALDCLGLNVTPQCICQQNGSDAGGLSRGGASLMSSSRGGLTSPSASGPNRCSTRPSTKASSAGVKPSPSRPQPKCFSRCCITAYPPRDCGLGNGITCR